MREERRRRRRRMRVVVEEEEAEVMYPSTPGKVKVEQRSSAAMSRQVHRCFASTGTMFLWALFLVAMTATYLSFRSLAGDAAASPARERKLRYVAVIATRNSAHRNMVPVDAKHR